ncbi:MAG: zinc-binding dehydrogenase [Candidatus Latescibacteria bacterium]|nr:zinc-binding dehydrogenase [Candidatus Latescibacterota bacterium]
MPDTARAVVTVGERFEIREYPIPDTEPGTILLRQELAGICGTDLHNWEHERLEGEIIYGHENVGTVHALGEGVETDYLGRPLAEGDRVILVPGTTMGAYGFLQAEEQPYLRGGFADYIYLWNPDTVIFKTELPPEVAVLAEPFTIGVHGVLRAQMKFGDTVVVQGTGAIGLLTLVCAKLSGAGRMIVVGGPEGRLDLARRIGADVTIDIDEVRDPDDRKALVLENTQGGEGAGVVFECAGTLSAIPEGLDYLRKGGTYTAMGHFVDVGTFPCNPNQMLMRKDLRLEAVWASGVDHFVRGLPVLEKNEFPYSEMVSHILPLDRVADGFNALRTGYQLDGRAAVKIAVQGGAA